jgi:hypothetical protein
MAIAYSGLRRPIPSFAVVLNIVFVLMCDKYILSPSLSTTFLFSRLNQSAQLWGWDKGLATETRRQVGKEKSRKTSCLLISLLLVSVSLCLCGCQLCQSRVV